MQWQIDYSLRTNAYLRKRFIIGLAIALIIVYGFVLVIILFGHDWSQGLVPSGYGVFLGVVSVLFWFITGIVALTQMITYTAHYQIDNKSIRVRIKAKKPRKRLLGILDFINASTYQTHPGNLSIHSLGSQGSLKITWRNTRRIQVFKKHQTALIKGRLGEKMPVYYSQEQEKDIIVFLKRVYPEIELIG